MKTKNLLYPTLLLILIASANSAQAQIANSYTGDVGIENDPNVLYVEKFDDGLSNIMNRYTVTNNQSFFTDTDVPAGSPGPNSLKITNIGGQNSGGNLFKGFTTGGFNGTVYLRYYVKYSSASQGYIHHASAFCGGYNPPSNWANPQAGTCTPDRININYEPGSSGAVAPMHTYIAWGDMPDAPPGSGYCWGNDMVHGSPTEQNIAWDQWMCVEVMVKLNNPVTAYNGEMRVWQNGVEVGYWGPGFPNGHWYGAQWINDPADATTFQGFRWRTDANLNINWLWILYYDDTSPTGVSHNIKYDHLVMAKQYIGPLKAATGINEDQNVLLPIQIYPNPATHNLTLSLPNTNSKTEITIYNTLGEKIVESTTSIEKTELNISKLIPGVYMLEAKQGSKISRQKFIKQ